MARAKTTQSKKAPKEALVSKSLSELQAELDTVRADHVASRRGLHQGEVVNPRVITAQRKQIARLLTAINAAKRAEVNPAVDESEEK